SPSLFSVVERSKALAGSRAVTVALVTTPPFSSFTLTCKSPVATPWAKANPVSSRSSGASAASFPAFIVSPCRAQFREGGLSLPATLVWVARWLVNAVGGCTSGAKKKASYIGEEGSTKNPVTYPQQTLTIVPVSVMADHWFITTRMHSIIYNLGLQIPSCGCGRLGILRKRPF